ncbi:MAG: DsrE family protein [Desulfobulbaceae bacterium]|nr:MAG: DsrE family protein [Desulfobulbaceae bacterium]
MENKTDLYILWTSDNPITAEKMVFMYGINSLLRNWWERVTIIVWGAAVEVAAENQLVKEKIKEALDTGVHLTACKACADQLGATDNLESQGIEVIYWGEPLTSLLKDNQTLLTI